MVEKLESKSTCNSIFGKCLDCGKDRSSERWCKNCAFKEDCKSGNINIDDFIKHTQLNATGIEEYLEYIDCKQFDLIEKTGKGGEFSTVYSAIWVEGPRCIWDEDAEQWTRSGPIKVALKKLCNPQDINEEFLKRVS